MGRGIVAITNDNNRLFALANDASLWTTDTASPMTWSQLPAVPGQKAVAIGVANRLPPQSGQTRYVVCGNGQLYHLEWSTDGTPTWVQDQGLP